MLTQAMFETMGGAHSGCVADGDGMLWLRCKRHLDSKEVDILRHKINKMSDNKPRDTTDGLPADPEMEGQGAPKPINPKTGQHGAYYVLPEEERAKGYVRLYRDTYLHRRCNATTKMGKAIATKG